MNLGILVAVLLHSVFHIHCFNIDTKFPIIYSKPIDKFKYRNSYFGFSVLLHKEWVLVGAPRANSTNLSENVIEPGVPYRCPIFKTCTEVKLDGNNNTMKDDSILLMDLKNNAWIGGAMAMESGPGGRIVVCGHRWKNQAFDEYDMTGICYVSRGTNYEEMFKYILPKEVYDKQGKSIKTYKENNFLVHEFYKRSQIGMSVYIAPPTKKSISMLIGAPGAGTYWTGGVVEYMSEPIKPSVHRRKRDVQQGAFDLYVQKPFIDITHFNDIRVFSHLDDFNYIGYEVAAGYFFSKEQLFHVAGSPRAHNLKGLVAIYGVNYINKTPFINNPIVKEGKSFGEYFGSSLAVADVTGDGLHDLIVGAPLFSLRGDEGRIYVFTKYSSSQKLEDLGWRDGFKIGGRFGTAIASLGDIDQDGREDVAVGAPYEDSGVIYIYNDLRNGLNLKYSQRIGASDIHKSIRGFGISISKPTDIDGNQFTDVAVGSYLSEHVVLLRSYPVIDLGASGYSKVKQFNVNHTEFKINVCLFYNGSMNVPNNIEVVRNIDVDIKFHRFKPVPAKKFTLLKRNQIYCDDVNIQIKEESNIIHNDFSDIIIVISQSMKEQENNTSKILWVDGSPMVKDADKFCSSCPVVRNIYHAEIDIPFTRDCKDGECKSDAKLHCAIMQKDKQLSINSYIIGTTPILKLTVDLHNKGDPLYTKVKIDIPREIELAQVPPTCQYLKVPHLAVLCRFGRINDGEMRTVNISLDLSSFETLRLLSEEKLPLLINVSVSEDNYKELDVSNNKCNIKLELIMEADVDITGKSDKDVFFSKSDSKELPFEHTYEVSNVGFSPIRHVKAFFHIPVEWHGSESPVLLSNPLIEAQQNGKNIFCDIFETNYTSSKNIYQKSELSVVKKGSKVISVSDNHPSNRTIYVNCSSNVMCKTWICNFMEFKANTTAKIVITAKLNISKLVPVMGHKDIIHFSSHGHIEMVDSKNIQRPGIQTQHDVTVTSAAIGTVTHEKIQLWIIILCILVGILLIAAMIIGLAKAGFFKRAKAEELQALKRSENSPQ